MLSNVICVPHAIHTLQPDTEKLGRAQAPPYGGCPHSMLHLGLSTGGLLPAFEWASLLQHPTCFPISPLLWQQALKFFSQYLWEDLYNGCLGKNMGSSNDFGLKIMSIPQAAMQHGSAWADAGLQKQSEKNPSWLCTELLYLGGREKEVARLGLHCSLWDLLGPPCDAAVLT